MAAIATDDCNSWTGLVQEMENKVAKEHYVQHHMHFGPDFEQTPLSLSCGMSGHRLLPKFRVDC